MRIEQDNIRTVVKPTVRHQLVHVRLTDTLLRVVDTRGHAFPFGVDDQHDLLVLPDDDVWARPKQA